MNKILFAFLFVFMYINVFAIEDIKIDNNSLIPTFEKSIKKYNYFTNKDMVNINIKSQENEMIFGEKEVKLIEGNNKIIISSNIDGDYELNITKNYKKENKEKGVLNNLIIKGYNINFNRNIHEYSVTTSNSDALDIIYELNNPSSYVQITGNGNFNHSKNTITINVDNISTYKVNVFKATNVSKEIVEEIEVKEMSYIKKEIIKILIIIISCTIIFYLYYLLFIKKLF